MNVNSLLEVWAIETFKIVPESTRRTLLWNMDIVK